MRGGGDREKEEVAKEEEAYDSLEMGAMSDDIYGQTMCG